MESIRIETAFYVLEALVAASLIGAIYFAWKQIRKSKYQRHAHKVVDSLGVKYLRDVTLPDGIDGLVFMDYLLLVPGGFVVVDTQHSAGHLFGGETVDQWSQVINNKTYKFANPLYANQSACQALQWNLQHNADAENLPTDFPWQIQGWVTFSSAGNFPKGIPAQVSMIDELKDKLSPLLDGNGSGPEAINEDLQNAWKVLQKISAATHAENRH
jgi:hypothetical protein